MLFSPSFLPSELEHQDIDHNAFSHSNNSLIEGQSPANSMASLTEEERKEMKKLITNMLFDMGSQWIQADRPALKRLVKRLLNSKPICTLPKTNFITTVALLR